MRFFVFLTAVICGYYAYSQKFSSVPPRLDDSHSDVIMYSLTTCGYCKTLRKELDEEGVSFTEVFIDRNRDAREELSTKLTAAGFKGGRVGTPTLDVKGHMLVNNPSLRKILSYVESY